MFAPLFLSMDRGTGIPFHEKKKNSTEKFRNMRGRGEAVTPLWKNPPKMVFVYTFPYLIISPDLKVE